MIEEGMQTSLWEVYGLKGNPYSTNPLLKEGGFLPIEEAFVGREQEKVTLLKFMDDEQGCLFVCGNVGVGKTSLLNLHKHRCKQKKDPVFSARKEIDMHVDLLNRKMFLLELISSLYGEVKLLDQDIVHSDDFMKKTAMLVDFTSKIAINDGWNFNIGLVSAGTNVEQSGKELPNQLTDTYVQQYFRDFISWICEHSIGGKEYKKVLIHVNNFDVVLQEEEARVKSFLNEIRDILQTPHIFFSFLGPQDFYRKTVVGNPRLQSVCYHEPLFLDSLKKRELVEALEKRYELLRIDGDINVIEPLTEQAIHRFHDIYQGDIRSILRACSQVINALRSTNSSPLDADSALTLLYRIKSEELERKGIVGEKRTVLSQLIAHPEGVSQKEVAIATGKSPSNISGFYFKEFLDKGIIEEYADEQAPAKRKWKLRPEFAPLYSEKELQKSVHRTQDKYQEASEQLTMF